LKELAQELSKDAAWIDAPALVANKVATLWSNTNHQSADDGEVSYFLSDKTESFMELAKSTFGIHASWETVVLP